MTPRERTYLGWALFLIGLGLPDYMGGLPGILVAVLGLRFIFIKEKADAGQG